MNITAQGRELAVKWAEKIADYVGSRSAEQIRAGLLADDFSGDWVGSRNRSPGLQVGAAGAETSVWLHSHSLAGKSVSRAQQ